MDDIWAAYYMQSKGYKVVFNSASVYQERNPHDLTKDMKKEYLGYENNLNLVNDIKSDPNAKIVKIRFSAHRFKFVFSTIPVTKLRIWNPSHSSTSVLGLGVSSTG